MVRKVVAQARSDRYNKLINSIAQYVHQNLSEDLSLERLAKEFHVSRFHLNRLFHAATGVKLGAFIQRRRLEQAYYLLAEKQATVLEAAVAVGYDSHAAFTRAFAKLFSIEPKQVKAGDAPEFTLPNVKKIATEPCFAPDILELPSRTLRGLYGCGFANQSFFRLASSLYQTLADTLGLTNGFDFSKQMVVGVAIDSPWRGDQTESRFFAGVDVEIAPDSEQQVAAFRWEGGRWARFEHIGPYQTMWQTILSIYSNWIIPNGYELRDCSVIQHYLNDAMTTPADELRTHIYIPLADNGE